MTDLENISNKDLSRHCVIWLILQLKLAKEFKYTLYKFAMLEDKEWRLKYFQCGWIFDEKELLYVGKEEQNEINRRVNGLMEGLDVLYPEISGSDNDSRPTDEKASDSEEPHENLDTYKKQAEINDFEKILNFQSKIIVGSLVYAEAYIPLKDKIPKFGKIMFVVVMVYLSSQLGSLGI